MSDYQEIKDAVETALGGIYLDREAGGVNRETIVTQLKLALAIADAAVAEQKVHSGEPLSNVRGLVAKLQKDRLLSGEVASRIRRELHVAGLAIRGDRGERPIGRDYRSAMEVAFGGSL